MSRGMRVRSSIEFPAGDLVDGAFGLPEVRGGGFNVWSPRQPQAIGRHSHDRWEFCLLVSGAMDWWIEGEFHHIRSREWFLIRPRERHDGADRIRHRSAICWLGLQVAIDELPGLEPAHAHQLAVAFASLSSRRFPASEGGLAAFADVLSAARASSPLRELPTRAALHTLLASMVKDHQDGAEPGVPREADATIARAVAILRERLGAPIAVAELAKAVGLSRSVLHQRFLAELGISPMSYWTRLRVERAKELLRAHQSSADIAGALGFASPQHFARVFKQACGSTPGAWKVLAARGGSESSVGGRP